MMCTNCEADLPSGPESEGGRCLHCERAYARGVADGVCVGCGDDDLPLDPVSGECVVCQISEPRDAEAEAIRAESRVLREKVARLEAKVKSQGEVLSYCASVPNEADRRFVQRLVAEVICARRKFPSSAYMFAALIEEVGEVGQAICEGDKEGLRDELVQVACTRRSARTRSLTDGARHCACSARGRTFLTRSASTPRRAGTC